MSVSETMRRRGAPAGGAGIACRSQASCVLVAARSAPISRAVVGSRSRRARSITAGPRTGTRAMVLRIVASREVLLGEPQIVGLVDVERILGVHDVAEGLLAIERAAAQRLAADDQDRRAVARDDM